MESIAAESPAPRVLPLRAWMPMTPNPRTIRSIPANPTARL
jgi:hypothetical protein